MSDDPYYLNRSLCDVLEELRKCWETRNFAPMLGLIEEAQSMGNRMEAALADQKDLRRMHAEWAQLRKEVKELRRVREDLKEELDNSEPPYDKE